MDAEYRPIDCEFHDQLEGFATLRKKVRLTLNGAAPAEGRIDDIYTTPSKEEYLRLENGASIRLDRIMAVTPLS